jgi:hypothetical protein
VRFKTVYYSLSDLSLTFVDHMRGYILHSSARAALFAQPLSGCSHPSDSSQWATNNPRGPTHRRNRLTWKDCWETRVVSLFLLSVITGRPQL